MYKCAFALSLSLFVFALFALPAQAQAPAIPEKTESVEPGRPFATASATPVGAVDAEKAANPGAAPAESPDQPQNKNLNPPLPLAAVPERHFRIPEKVADKKFLAFAALQVAATVADFETTQWAQRKAPNGAEQNPLFGSHPSRARMYSIGFSLTSLQLYMQFRSKRYGERSGRMKHAWIVGALFDTGLHTYLAVHNGQIATRGN